jgi:hypothetical protein
MANSSREEWTPGVAEDAVADAGYIKPLGTASVPNPPIGDCLVCGSGVLNPELHQRWHDQQARIHRIHPAPQQVLPYA